MSQDHLLLKFSELKIIYKWFNFFSKFQEQMVLRHHNEAESLNAVQKLDWEWKLSELNEENNTVIDDLYIPMVRVSDEFCLSVQ